MRILTLLLLAGCQSLPYTVPPQLTTTTVSVKWSSPERIKARCGEDKVACATVASPALPFSLMWVERPESFDDPRVCALGHELLHALGARHE